jgi:transposase
MMSHISCLVTLLLFLQKNASLCIELTTRFTEMIESSDIKNIDHLGLVAATIAHTNLIQKINQRLSPKHNTANVTHGERVACMILTAFGYMNTRLYLTADFLRNKPIQLLLGRHLEADQFNDDALGRTLDAISDYGVTKFFSEIFIEIGIENDLIGKTVHFDTTSLMTHGAYDQIEEESTASEEKTEPLAWPKTAVPAYGYSKDHRNDLKQMVLNMATTAKGFPLWMEAHSGNASDKVIIHQAANRMRNMLSAIKDAPDFIVVADSASFEGFIDSSNFSWITRVPETHKMAKQWVREPAEKNAWFDITEGYRGTVIEHTYRNIAQRWIKIHSEQAYARENKTFDRKLITLENDYTQALKSLSRQAFTCEKDAESELEKFAKKLKYFTVEGSITESISYAEKGRPRKGVTGSTQYHIHGVIHPHPELIKQERQSKGCFILASNVLDKDELPDRDILRMYKDQAGVERGFRMIKSDSFEVSSIFLKKTERINALMGVMVSTLLVFGMSEHTLRKNMAEQQMTVTHPGSKKEVAKPSMQLVCLLMQGIYVVHLKDDGSGVGRDYVANLREKQQKIVRVFGAKAMEIYGVS